MVYLKNADQIECMRKAGQLLYEVLCGLREMVKPGVSTKELDEYAERRIRNGNAIPSFLNYEGFPASLCTSVDEQIVHAIPSPEVILKEGSIISIDCGLILNGWQSDSAFTLGVGSISADAAALIEVTEQCFWRGIRKAVVGNRLGDMGYACQSWAEQHGCGVIRSLTGHGIGREMHEDPPINNFGDPGHGMRLRRGMTLAFEPMICAGDWHTLTLPDRWTVVTRDGSLCAHYEHTIAVTDGLPEILSLPDFKWEGEPS